MVNYFLHYNRDSSLYRDSSEILVLSLSEKEGGSCDWGSIHHKGGKGGKKKDLGSTGPQPGSSSSVASDMNIDMEAEDEEEILQQIDVLNFQENVESILTD